MARRSRRNKTANGWLCIGLVGRAIGAVIAGDAMLLAAAAIPAWLARSTPPPALPVPLEIRVIAEQVAWNIHYPGADGTFGRTSQAFIGAANPVGIDRSDPDAWCIHGIAGKRMERMAAIRDQTAE